MRRHLKKLKARIRVKRKLHHKPRRRLFMRAAASGAVALPAGVLMAANLRPGASPANGATRGRYPNVLLTRHEGKRVRFYDDVIAGDKIVVLNMMYTQCPEVCGGTMINLARVQNLLADRMGRDVVMYSVSLDPKHDTPEVLARYAQITGVGEHWKLLTGRPTDIERLRRALGYVDPDPELDSDRNQHIGMVRAGNDAIDRWLACPGMAPAAQLAQEVLWAGRPAQQA